MSKKGHSTKKKATRKKAISKTTTGAKAAGKKSLMEKAAGPDPRKRLKKTGLFLLKLSAVLLLPYIIFFALEFFTHDPWKMLSSPVRINYLIFLLASILLWSITNSYAPAITILAGFSAFVGIANYFVMAFRNNPILPWDLQSIGTAVEVMDNYEWKINYRFVVSVLLLLFLLVGVWLICKRMHTGKLFKKPGLKKRLAVSLLSFAGITAIFFAMMDTDITDKYLKATNLFTQWASYRDNGFVVSFMQNMQYMRISKPDGYDEDTLDDELAAFLTDYKASHPDYSGESADLTENPTIIVLMDEAYSDLSVLHDFETDVDYKPYVRSLEEADSSSVITGNLFVSVCGGNTANTEFEFLTGNTLAFLPSGSVPYQQYVLKETNSIASQLTDTGYETYGLHPYNASGWCRNTVYPRLGFEKAIFKSGFKNAATLRKYITDQSAFQKIYSLDEASDSADPGFYFEVTMQNHGGYSEIFDNCPIQVRLQDINSKTNEGTENYLTLVKYTDEAFQELTKAYADSEKPVIIVLFGDHQPNDYVSEKIAALTGTKKDDRSLAELQNRYIVPYVIWANFDLDKETAGLVSKGEAESSDRFSGAPDVAKDNLDANTLSVNYLGAALMRLSGQETSAYQDFLLILKETLPVITANTAIDADGNYMTIEEAKEAYPELMNLYEKLQYRELFD